MGDRERDNHRTQREYRNQRKDGKRKETNTEREAEQINGFRDSSLYSGVHPESITIRPVRVAGRWELPHRHAPSEQTTNTPHCQGVRLE